MGEKTYDLMTKLFRVSEGEFLVRLDDVIEAQIRDLQLVKERLVQSQMDNVQTLSQIEKVLKELHVLKELSWEELKSQKQF